MISAARRSTCVRRFSSWRESGGVPLKRQAVVLFRNASASDLLEVALRASAWRLSRRARFTPLKAHVLPAGHPASLSAAQPAGRASRQQIVVVGGTRQACFRVTAGWLRRSAPDPCATEALVRRLLPGSSGY